MINQNLYLNLLACLIMWPAILMYVFLVYLFHVQVMILCSSVGINAVGTTFSIDLLFISIVIIYFWKRIFQFKNTFFEEETYLIKLWHLSFGHRFFLIESMSQYLAPCCAFLPSVRSLSLTFSLYSCTWRSLQLILLKEWCYINVYIRFSIWILDLPCELPD